jgi:hypothetical protein
MGKIDFDKMFYSLVESCWKLILITVNIFFTLLFSAGAIAAIVLLYKSYPNLALIILSPVYLVFTFLIFMLRGCLSVIVICGVCYFFLSFYRLLQNKKNWRIRRNYQRELNNRELIRETIREELKKSKRRVKK